ncbi:recombinase family protein (plasmid) [Haloarcula salina]|uniref:recombinase family protein n=1 Tax=Haloarcula salina TaxID=1429914 RepID=UPI003C6EE63A
MDGEDTLEPDKDLDAAIYARTSSNSQRFGYSIDEQVRRCWELCENASWDVAFVFSDEAESGRDTERPEFQSMLKRARENLFDVVVFWKLDRFCRSLVDLVKTEEELDDLGVGLHSVTEFLDTTNPVGRFNFRNLASAAELESDLTSQRVKLGMYGLARERKWPNDHPPLGYEKNDDGTLRIDESERQLVYLIFRLYIQEHSMPQVAFLLNQRSKTTSRGDSWCRQSVGKVLRNKLYIGHYQIADFEANVEEYRILPDSVFEEATEARFRFKHAQAEMDNSRKQSKAERIVDEYRTYQDEESS